MTTIYPLPPNLPGQDSPADRKIAEKVNELVAESNADGESLTELANATMESLNATADELQSLGARTTALEERADETEKNIADALKSLDARLSAAETKGNALAGQVADLEGRVSVIEGTVSPLPVTTVVLTPNPLSVKKGQTVAPALSLATADGTPVPPDDRDVVWGSSNPAVASVSEAGVVTGVAAGNATITATCEGVQGPAVVSVTEIVVPPVTGWVSVLPQKTVPLDYVPATGTSRSVATDGELRAAIAASVDGDEIVVKANITGNGLYQIDKRITIRALTLTAPGRRVTPTMGLPKILCATQAPVFHFVKGSGARLVGLEIGCVPAMTETYTLVTMGHEETTTLADQPTNCVVDRCVVMGHPTLDLKRAISLQSIGGGVVDSWLSAYSIWDAAAVWGWNGPGPYTIKNCRLEASGENWMFGGADPRIPNLVPSDILIDGCHIPKDYARGQPKNFGEAKNGRRIHQTRCVIEGIGEQKSTQPGYATTLSATDQNRMAPWSMVQDVTISWCVYKNVKAFLNVTGWVYDNERFWTKRVSVQDCLIRDLGSPDVGIIIQQHTENVECVRTTYEKCGYVFLFEARTKLDGGIKGVRLLDNAGACGTAYQLSDPMTMFDQYAPGRIIEGNQWSGYSEAPPLVKGVDRTQLAAKLAGVVVAA
jgi:cell division protein ZapA (FtsZ GTPase activity inhibitor)